MKPLLKQVARPGRFTNYADGQLFDLTPAQLAAAVKGSNALIQDGFNVRAFPSHDANDSLSVLGDWLGFAVAEDGSAYGTFLPRSEAARQTVAGMDVSIVMEEQVTGRTATQPLAFTRVDVVPQGAIVGLAPFIQLSHTAQKRVFIGGCTMPKVTPLSRALAQKVGLADDTPMDMIEQHLMQALQIAEMAEDEQMAALAAFMSPEQPDAEPSVDASSAEQSSAAADTPSLPEEEKDPEMQALQGMPGFAKLAQQLQAQRSAIAALQQDKLAALVASLPSTEKQNVLALAKRIAKGSGFDVAFEAAQAHVAAFSRALPKLAASGVRVAERPKAPEKKIEAERKAATQKLIAAAARMGMKPREQQGA